MKNSMKWLLPAGLVVIAVLAGVFYMKSTVTHAEALPPDSIRSQLEVMYNGRIDKLKLHNEVYEAELTRAGSVYKVQVEGDTGRVMAMDLVSAAPDLAAEQHKNGEQKQDSTKEDSSSNGKTPPAGTSEQPPAAEQKPAGSNFAGQLPADSQKPAASQKPANQKPAVATPKPAPQPKPQQQAPTHSQQPPVQKPAPQKPTPQKTVLLTEQQAVQIALRQLNGEVDDVDFVKTTDGGYYLVEIEIDVDDGPDEATYQIHAISGKIMSVTWDD